jgi:hypothetical protein
VNVNYVLELEVPTDALLRAALIAEGAIPTNVETQWVLSSKSAVEGVRHVLMRRRTGFRVFYRLAPEASDATRDLCCYLALKAWDETQRFASDEYYVSRDVATSTVVATRAVIDILSSVTAEVRFEPMSSGLFRLAYARDLPDPVVVPVAFFTGKADDGTWAVQSDGRELLTKSNRQAVRESGLVHAPRAVVGHDLLRWRRPPVVSGDVWAALEAIAVEGLDKPPPYLGGL